MLMQAGKVQHLAKGATHMHLGGLTGRAEITNQGVKLIYNQYNAVRKKRKYSVDIEKVTDKFFADLTGKLDLSKMRIRPEIGLQLGSEDVNVNTLDEIQKREDYRDLKGCFIHFIKMNIHVSDRVYINLRQSMRGEAFAKILKRIWDIDGIQSAKVSMPGFDAADSAVVYCRDHKTKDEVLEVLRRYQKRHSLHFGHSVPKMVQQYPDLRGVGFGMEPPRMIPKRSASGRFTGSKGAMSFGYYRAQLLYIALEQTEFPEEKTALNTHRMAMNFTKHANPVAANIADADRRHQARVTERWHEFTQNVLDIFERAGIDVAKPYYQQTVQWDPEKDVVMAPPPPKPSAAPAAVHANVKKKGFFGRFRRN